MDANLAVLIVYIAMAIVSWIPYLGWIAWAVPLVFFFLEKSSGFVKFHAVQALGIGILRAALTIVFNIIYWVTVPQTAAGVYASLGAWAVIGVIATIIYLVILVVIVYVMIMAWQWKQVELPFIGPMATKAGAKLDDIARQQGFGGANQPPQQQQPWQYQQQPPQQPQQQPGQYQPQQQPPQPGQYQQQPPQQQPWQYQQQPPQQPGQFQQQPPQPPQQPGQYQQQPPQPPQPGQYQQQPPQPPVQNNDWNNPSNPQG